MSSYSGNCLSFRSGSIQSKLTNSHTSEGDMIYELIGIVCAHTDDLLPVADYLAIHTDATMTQDEYIVLVRSQVTTFAQFLEWCKTYCAQGDFNNFETGWSVSMSVYS